MSTELISFYLFNVNMCATFVCHPHLHISAVVVVECIYEPRVFSHSVSCNAYVVWFLRYARADFWHLMSLLCAITLHCVGQRDHAWHAAMSRVAVN